MNVRILGATVALGIGSIASWSAADAQSTIRREAPAARVMANTTNRASHTCAGMNRGNVVGQPDGGMVEYPQGWLFRTEVVQSASGWAFAKCSYGFQQLSAANTFVYTVSYEMKGFKSNQCSVSGTTVSCAR